MFNKNTITRGTVMTINSVTQDWTMVLWWWETKGQLLRLQAEYRWKTVFQYIWLFTKQNMYGDYKYNTNTDIACSPEASWRHPWEKAGPAGPGR